LCNLLQEIAEKTAELAKNAREAQGVAAETQLVKQWEVICNDPSVGK